MILENRRTRKKRTITLDEFKKEFANEINVSFESYEKTQISKQFFKFNRENNIESDYYFNFQWNFNNFCNSVWFIKKM